MVNIKDKIHAVIRSNYDMSYFRAFELSEDISNNIIYDTFRPIMAYENGIWLTVMNTIKDNEEYKS